MLVKIFNVHFSGKSALKQSFISGTWVRPIESYITWCQIQSKINFSFIISLLHATALILIILVCQAYVLFKAQINTCAVIIKHSFVAFIFFASITINLLLLFNIEFNIKQAIPISIYLFIILPLFINIGFLIKEREFTFPIIEDLLKNPCSSSVSTVTQDSPSMYPDWLEMYPVHE